MYEYEIPDCQFPCTLDKLEKARFHIIPLNWPEECGIYSSYQFNFKTNIIIIGILILLCGGLIIELILINNKIKRKYGNKMDNKDIIFKSLLLDNAEKDEYP